MRGNRHLRTALRVAMVGGAIGTFLMSDVPSWAQQPVDWSRVKTSGKSTRPQRSLDQEVPSVVPRKLPHPGSMNPDEVMENVKFLARELQLEEGIKTALQSSDVRASRILSVKSDMFPGGYLVVEVEDTSGRRLANFAMTHGGSFVMSEDLRTKNAPRSLDLTDAASKVQERRGQSAQAVEYVYFHNVAERGISLCRPLVEVITGTERIYLNSAGEAFVEDETIDPVTGKVKEQSSQQKGPRSPLAARGLRSLGRW